MSMKKTNSSGMGFAGTLTLIFIVLKLCGLIDWKWITVFSPMIISFLIWIVLVILVIISQKY